MISAPPYLLAAGGHYAPFASLEQVGVTPEAVMAVGCLVICTPHGHQEPGITKDTKQAVPPHRYSRCLQCRPDQTVELAGADAWLTGPIATHQGDRPCALDQLLLLAMAGLVVRLPTNAEMSASPCHA